MTSELDQLQIRITADASSACDSLNKLVEELKTLKKSLAGIGYSDLGELSKSSKKAVSDFAAVNKKIEQTGRNLAAIFSNAGPKWDISKLEKIGMPGLQKGIEQTTKKLDKLANREEMLKLTGRNAGAGWESVQYRISAALNQLAAYQQALQNLNSLKIDIPISMPESTPGAPETERRTTTSDSSMNYDSSAMAAVFPEFSGIQNFGEAVEQLGSQAGLVMNGFIEQVTLADNELDKAGQSAKNLDDNIGLIDTSGLERIRNTLSQIVDERLGQLNSGFQSAVQRISSINFKDWHTWAGLIGKIPARIGKMVSAAEGITKIGEKIKSVFSRISETIKNFGSGISNAVKKVKEFGKKSDKASKGNTFGFGNAIGMSVAFSAVYSAINAIQEAIRAGSGNLAQYSSSFNSSISGMMSGLTQLKNAFAVAFSPIVEIVAPAITTFINLLSRALNLVGAFFSALTGKSMATQAVSVTEDYAASVSGVGNAADESKKKLSNLLGIDELNVLNQEESALNGGSGGGSGVPATDMFETVSIPDSIMRAANELKTTLGGIFQPFRNAWESTGAMVIQSASNALSNIGNLAQSIGQSLYDVWTNGSGETALTSILNIISNIFDIAGGLAERLRIAWDAAGTGTSIIQSVFDIFNSVLSTLDRITEQTAIWVQSLDFTPLLTSVLTLLEALEPFTDTIGEGLEWFWTNVLLPIAGWTLQEAVPAFLDMLASGVTALNDLLITFQPLGQWLWDNFLLPVGQWAGDTVIEALGLVTEQLQKFSDWIEGNQGINNLVDLLDKLKINAENLGENIQELLTPAFEFMMETVIPGVQSAFQRLIDILTPFGEFLSQVFTSIWQDMIKPALTYVGETVVPTVTETFENLWNKVLVPLANFLDSVLTPVIEVVSDVLTFLWQNVGVPFAEFIGAVFAAKFELLATLFNTVVIPVVQGVIDIFSFLWNDVFVPIATYLGDTFGPLFETVFNTIKNIIEDAKATFRALIDFINNVFKGDWEGAWNSVKDVFKGILNGLVDIAEGCFNFIIRGINKLLDGIQSVADTVGDVIGLDIDVPHLKEIELGRFSTGGFPKENGLFMANSTEIIGRFTNGKTAVANNKQIISGISRGVSSAVENVLSKFTITANLEIPSVQVAGMPSLYSMDSYYRDRALGYQMDYGTNAPLDNGLKEVIRNELIPLIRTMGDTRDELLQTIADKGTNTYLDGRKVNRVLSNQQARSGYSIRK